MVKIIDSNFKPEQVDHIHDLVEPPKAVPIDYKTSLVDNTLNRTDTLLEYVDGSRQKVVYFRQRLGMNDSKSGYSTMVNGSIQQYDRIDNLEIYMQGGLDSSYSNTEQTITEVTGIALVKYPVIPNEQDIILMDFGRGTIGWFTVTSVMKKTHRKNSLYEIQISLTYEIRDQYKDKKLLDLNSKIVEVLTYSNDYSLHNQNPLLTPKQVISFNELMYNYDKISKYWFKKFYNGFYETMFIPNQKGLIYDSFFMKGISKWFSSSKYKEMIDFRLYDVSEYSIFDNPDIWSSIYNKDLGDMRDSFKHCRAVPVEIFTDNSFFTSIRFSGFSYVLTPLDVRYSNNIYINNDRLETKSYPFLDTVSSQNTNTVNSIPLINQVLLNRSYVLSLEFYDNSYDGQSHLELQLRKYLEDLPLDLDIVSLLCKDYRNWGELEQYYYIPILLVLIQYGIKHV